MIKPESWVAHVAQHLRALKNVSGTPLVMPHVEPPGYQGLASDVTQPNSELSALIALSLCSVCANRGLLRLLGFAEHDLDFILRATTAEQFYGLVY